MEGPQKIKARIIVEFTSSLLNVFPEHDIVLGHIFSSLFIVELPTIA